MIRYFLIVLAFSVLMIGCGDSMSILTITDILQDDACSKVNLEVDYQEDNDNIEIGVDIQCVKKEEE